MKNQVLFVSLLFSLFTSIMGYAQEEKLIKKDTVDGRVDKLDDVKKGDLEKHASMRDKEIALLNQTKASYEVSQRVQLASFVKTINERVQKKNLDEDRASVLKNEFAESTAARIQKHNEAIDAQIEFINVKDTFSAGSTLEISVKKGINLEIDATARSLQKEIKTTSGYTLTVGYNFMNGSNLGIDDFSYGNKNNYFAIAHLWKTRLDANDNFRLSYGLEYQTHGTMLNGNRVFSQNGASTQVIALGLDADKVKFRQDQLVIPLHFEISGSKRIDCEDGRVRFNDDGKWKVGLGGFAGFNLSSRIKLKYEVDGRDIKESIVNAFDTQPFIYGLDAYVGKGVYNVFGRLNLNDVFKTGSVDAQYVSFGIRIKG